MASSVAAIQALALPPSSLLGDKGGQMSLCPPPCCCPCPVPNSISRLIHTMCLRRESSGGGGVDPSWVMENARAFAQTSAVAAAEYAVTKEEAEAVGVRRQGRLFFLDGDTGLGKDNENDAEEDNDDEENLLFGPEITSLNLRKELVSALTKRNITRLFPIQEAVLKPAMEGRDIIARAKTGTGKTLAFGIPIIQRLLEEFDQNGSRSRSRDPRALVLAPTRELAVQVEKEMMESAPFLSTICVYGGVSITAQQRKLWKGVDVAVGTPGRIIDLIERGSLNLKDVVYMVLDEADQMLAVGFEEDVERILEELPKVRQSMLFSATMPSWVKQLSRKYLNSPLTIDLVGESDEKLADNIKIYAVSTVNDAKRSILNDLITVYARGGKTIVFTQTKKDANDISLCMSRVHGCEALHGDITQMQREKTLNAFRSGKFSVLVATDVAARGLDIPNVDLIIHYDIPNDPETFVHRSGRTGRAGKAGTALLMHTSQQKRTVKLIEKDTGCKFEVVPPPHVSDVLKASSDQARKVLTKVHPELKDAFLDTAQSLLKEQGPEALAAAIAYMSGFTQPIASRSLITHEEGWLTLQITRTGQYGGGPLTSVRNVMGTLASICRSAADQVGKIYILRDTNGAIFDLPEEVAKELLSKQTQDGDFIEVAKKMPALEDDGILRDNYGRFSSRGGSRGSRGSSWNPRSRMQNECSSSWSDDRRFDRRHDEKYGGRNADFSRGKFDMGETWNRSKSPSKSMSFSRDRSFSGSCYVCGQPGHRAADCPMERSR